ncbi:unnamed protein product [Macrosiphum euphorbiae]|uniref:HAT C-terminal dimerisation domain-containing protein n=1 Tax=Macrosiphum euphorbiae TaxID=13131 RepID=A0AAV0WQK5_9HEMI|nr:unnamed protein product [Macrosiphum euphorbiae]
MSKVASTKRSKVSIYLEEFPNETFRSDGQVLCCQFCDKSVSIDQRGQVIQLINTSKHRGNKDRKLIFQQNFISTSSASTNSKDILLNVTPNNNYSEIEYTPKEIMCMKYVPVTSVDAERSFSRYKEMLRPNRCHFTF